jgi:hypothetical protein
MTSLIYSQFSENLSLNIRKEREAEAPEEEPRKQ